MKIIRVVFWLFILVFLAGVFLPQHYQVSRSVEIEATPAQIHRLVNDLTLWPQWSPWQELEPSVEITLGQTTSGVGASQQWTDNNGGGRLEFIASSKQSGIIYNIWFDDAKEPSVSHVNYAIISARKVKVEWRIEGNVQIPVVGFFLALVMDPMIGSAFELGLNNLKRQAETQ